jgi:DNA-binding MarR family transcriptional regulator
MAHNDSIRSIIEYNRILNLLYNNSVEPNNTPKVTSPPLTKNQYTILKILKITGSHLVGDIADLIQFSCAAASKNVDTLVNLKLVSRKITSGDRRKSSISILKKGEIIVRDFEGYIDKKRSNTLDSFSKKELSQLSMLLGKYLNQCLSDEKDFDLICLKCNGILNNECALFNYNVTCRFNIG